MSAGYELETDVNLPPQGSQAKALGAVALGCGLVAAGPLLERQVLAPQLSIFTLVAGLGLAIGVPAWLGRLRGLYHRVRVRIDADSVHLGEATLPRAAIRSAYFAPAAGNTRAGVRLLDAKNQVLATIATPDAAAAEPLIDALELGPQQRATRFYARAPRGSAAHTASLAVFIAGLALIAAGATVHPFLIGLGLVILVVGSSLLTKAGLRIGADGVLVDTRIAPRFISWSDVSAIEASANGVTFRLERGDEVSVPVATRRVMNVYDQQLQGAVLERSRAALEAFRRGARPNAEARVARRGRSLGEWTRELFDREGDFRQAPIRDEDMWRVVESAAAEASARAGAAAVLARAGDAAAQQRLRVAADACTEPKLRVVLEKAAKGVEEQELEAALGEVGEIETAVEAQRE